jgi:hypothetical protein
MSPTKLTGEPIVAHGARMSWAGILRPGNSFPTALSSRLGTLTTESGPPLRRFFGSWSARYRRFTSNLSSAKILVQTAENGQRLERGIQCVVHWVDSRAMRSLGPGSVCAGDGWPFALWKAFTSEIDNLPPGSLAERLFSFRDSRLQEGNPAVAEWRATLREGRLRPSAEPLARRDGWIPVPATLLTEAGSTACIVSWDSNGKEFHSLSGAIKSPGAQRDPPDLVSQARYYLECTLASLHGVRFGPYDAIEDNGFAHSREVLKLEDSLKRLEQERIANPKFGLLDRFGGRAPHERARPIAGPR